MRSEGSQFVATRWPLPWQLGQLLSAECSACCHHQLFLIMSAPCHLSHSLCLPFSGVWMQTLPPGTHSSPHTQGTWVSLPTLPPITLSTAPTVFPSRPSGLPTHSPQRGSVPTTCHILSGSTPLHFDPLSEPYQTYRAPPGSAEPWPLTSLLSCLL